MLAVPKVAIEGFYGTVREIMNIKDKKKKKKGNANSDGKESISEASTASQEEEEGSSDDDMLIVDDSKESGTSSRKALFFKYTSHYVMALILIVGMFAVITSVTYVDCLQLIQTGHRADLSLRIRYKLIRMGYEVHYLVVDDKATYPKIKDVKTHLEEDLEEFNEIQEALLNGNPEFGINYGT